MMDLGQKRIWKVCPVIEKICLGHPLCFMYCSLTSFTFKNEFWHQFCSFGRLFPSKISAEIHSNWKEEKKVIWQCSMTLICSACRVKMRAVVLHFFPENITYFSSVHWKFRSLESQVELLAWVRREMKMQFFRVNSIFDMLWQTCTCVSCELGV